MATSTTPPTTSGPDHYTRLPIQPWDFIAANEIGFFEGSAISYLCRWRQKGGVDDLRKAKHFVEKLIELHSTTTTERTDGESETAAVGTDCVCPRVRSGEVEYEPCYGAGKWGCRCQRLCCCNVCLDERDRAERVYAAVDARPAAE